MKNNDLIKKDTSLYRVIDIYVKIQKNKVRSRERTL